MSGPFSSFADEVDEFAMVAVRAESTAVLEVLRGLIPDVSSLWPDVSVIQFAKCDWTFVIWAILYGPSIRLNQSLKDQARDMSRLLGTRAISMAEENTSGVVGGSVFSKGRKLRSFEWETSQEQAREGDKLFEKEGIVLPVWLEYDDGKLVFDVPEESVLFNETILTSDL